jgi:hypothetical protein
VTRNYDLEARCSKDARVWFNQNYQRDKDTAMLDFSNHYQISSNQCFAFVELHVNDGKEGSWINDMSLWNVYENSRYGRFLEDHVIDFKNGSREEVVECDMFDKKCTSIDQFNAFARQYLND